MTQKIIREFNGSSQLHCGSLKMHATGERYYKVNRILLKTLGLWPYQQSYFSRIHKTLFVSLLLTFILVQLLVFVTTQYNTNLLLKIFSFAFPALFVTIKIDCISTIELREIWNEQVKKMLEQMRDDWRLLKDKLEVDIIEKYAYNLQFSTIISIVIGLFCSFLLIILQFLPLILDVILPLNESRPFQAFAITEYFFNQEKYIYIILLHEILAYSIGIIALYGTFITIMIYIWHACALLKITSYRIENAIEKSALAIPVFERHFLFYQKIVHAVLIHRRAIKFAKLITSNFTLLFAILIIVGVSSLSINLLQITLINDSTEDACIVTTFIVIHLSYMFIVNYGGQKVTDHGMELYKAIYNGLWYAAPLHIQKLLLFMMKRGNINVTSIFGGLYEVSLEGFASFAIFSLRMQQYPISW
ncbi:odorant receptor 22c-like isoform X2 [Polyergus mexicanus]|uniref:odorant receptor 22c-like isoform X2 n=1 Tax=Polyergus mexicanus TaxID=615972 RepID=UPI0038B4B3D6